MEHRTDEQTEVLTQSAGAEKEMGDKKTEVSFGKFKDAESLLGAYNALEAEFTRRSQRLRELEGRLASDKAKAPEQGGGEQKEKSDEKAQAQIVQKPKDDFSNGEKVVEIPPVPVKVMGGGAPVAMPPRRPKTIAEAGELARNFFSK